MPAQNKNKYLTYRIDRKKEYLCVVVIIAAIFAAVAVGYYYYYSLPAHNQQQLAFDIMKQSEEAAARKTELADKKEAENALVAAQIRDDCVKSAQTQIASDFGLGNLTATPFYYPYKDAVSFVKNERLMSAINSYRACLKNDPRYDVGNEYIKKLDDTALATWTLIREFLVSIKREDPAICNSSAFTEATKYMCVEFAI